METEIKKWGNSAVVRLPAALLAQLRLEVGAPVKLNAEHGRIVIEPSTERRYDLSKLVAGITRANRHETLDWGAAVGREAKV
jgi:antitoxin MazE